MKSKISRKTQIMLILVSLVLLLGSGCGEQEMKLKPIYDQAILGAIVGGIVGHQSDETGEGVAIGASLFALGEILNQVDNGNKKSDNNSEVSTRTIAPRETIKETYIIEIHNDNGSVIPIEIIKDGDQYVGPSGEHYDKLPTEAQLKPHYGL